MTRSALEDGAQNNSLYSIVKAAPLYPTMKIAGLTLIKRLSLIIDDGCITKVFYPVFPPDENAAGVLTWLRAHPR